MCLMLYLGTNGNLPPRAAPDLAVEEVETSREAVRQWFWNGNEELPPKGTIEVSLDSVKAETFLFTEQFFYRVARESRSDSAGPTIATGE